LIIGGHGHDTLTGGSEAISFQFSPSAWSATQAADSPAGAGDTITDFVRGEDKIDLHFMWADTKRSPGT